MKAKVRIAAFVLAGGMAAASAVAGVSSSFLGTAPAVPTAGHSFELQLQSGPCEFLSDDPQGALVDAIDGDVVTVRILAAPDLACTAPVGLRSYRVAGLPAGNYRVRAFFQSFDLARPPEFIGERLVTIANGVGLGATPAAIPTLGVGFAVALIGLVLAFAFGTAAMQKR